MSSAGAATARGEGRKVGVCGGVATCSKVYPPPSNSRVFYFNSVVVFSGRMNLFTLLGGTSGRLEAKVVEHG